MLARRTATVPGTWNSGAFGSGLLNVDTLVPAPLPPATTLVAAPAA